jgi:hypothetical protein
MVYYGVVQEALFEIVRTHYSPLCLLSVVSLLGKSTQNLYKHSISQVAFLVDNYQNRVVVD